MTTSSQKGKSPGNEVEYITELQVLLRIPHHQVLMSFESDFRETAGVFEIFLL